MGVNETLRIIISIAHRLTIAADLQDQLDTLKYISTDEKLPDEVKTAAAGAREHAQAFLASLHGLRNAAAQQLFVDPEKPDA